MTSGKIFCGIVCLFCLHSRILETQDEHFYALGFFGLPLSIGYHWPMYGFGLEDEVLRKVYRDNALKLLHPGTNRTSQ